jgi:hypothetical protein
LAYPFILPFAAAEYETGEVGGLEVETGINHCTLDRFGDGRHVENPLFEMITGVSENGDPQDANSMAFYRLKPSKT